MRRATFAAALALTAAGAGLGFGSSATVPVGAEVRASAPSQKQAPASPNAQRDQQSPRRRFVSASSARPQFKALRKPAGTHKQNRRRALAGR